MVQDELFSLSETLSSGVRDDRRSEARGKSSDIPLLVMDPRRLTELLQICTFIAQGQRHSCFLLMHIEEPDEDEFVVTKLKHCMKLKHRVNVLISPLCFLNT